MREAIYLCVRERHGALQWFGRATARALFFGIIVSFWFAYVLMNALPVYAQTAAGIKVQPSMIEERVEPGEVLETEIRVTNLNSVETTFYLMTADIIGVEGGGRPVFAPDNYEPTGYELSQWISFPEDELIMGPGASKVIPVTITVPEETNPGSHFGGIFVSFEPPSLRTTGAGVGYRVGSIVSLRLAGAATEEARLREFTSDKTLYKEPNIQFFSKVENLGNVLLRPIGLLEIEDMWGAKIATVKVNEHNAGVFPGSTRDFNFNWVDEDRIGFGRYQATFSMVYGQDGRKTITSTLSFWIIPLDIIVPALIALIVLILGIYFAIKFYIKRRMKEMEAIREQAIAQLQQMGGIQQPMQMLPTEVAQPEVPQSKQTSKVLILTLVFLVFTLLFMVVLFAMFA